MKTLTKALWNSFPCSNMELSLAVTLNCGQCFRWKRHYTSDGEECWIGVVGKEVWQLRQNENEVFYRIPLPSTEPPTAAVKKKQLVKIFDYFRLSVSLVDMYSLWAERDPNFKKICVDFPGIRMMRQEPVENVFSFICSSNNNIERISQMVEKMCTAYGERLGEVDGKEFHAFPTVEALCSPGVEEKLRQLGFGYRAGYIAKSAEMIRAEGGEKWLYSLRETSYDEAHSALVQLSGIGAKVADCISLMSLDHLGAIPVDTHVYQIAVRDYLPRLKTTKTVTTKVYGEVSGFFRELFGEQAGWAHTVLFSADLRKFKEAKKGVKKETIIEETVEAVVIKREIPVDAKDDILPSAKKSRRARRKY